MATTSKASATRAAGEAGRRKSAPVGAAAEPASAAPVITSVNWLAPPPEASLMWLNTNTQLMNNWLEWHNAMWQPWIDWQGAMTRQLGSAWLDPTMTPWLMRGTEQLA